MPTWVLVLWLLAGLGLWSWILRQAPSRFGGPPPDTSWRLGDRIAGLLLATLFVGNILAANAEKAPVYTPDMIRGGANTYAFLLAMLATFLLVRRISPLAAFGLRPRRPAVVAGFAGGAILATYPLVMGSQRLMEWLGASVSDSDPLVNFLRGGAATDADRLWVAALALVIAPVAEEVLFRGYLYGVLRQSIGATWSALTTALLFAAIHNNLPAVPALFVLALAFTVAYERTGSLWTPVLMHALFNGVTVVILFYFPELAP